MEHNMVGWFEIPVTDMQRARAFYEGVFEVVIEVHQLGELEMGWFPMADDKKGASGSLVKQPDFYIPSSTAGVVIYFSCKDVAASLERVTKGGGTVLQPKKEVGEGYGFMGLFLDTEGNRIALHSRA
jgi:predicted enzyme related to lactoylglutathione lyase